MLELTERQREVFEWIRAYSKANRRPPTVAEVAAQFGIAGPSAFCIMRSLVKKGYLEKGDGSARSVRPVKGRRCVAAVSSELARLREDLDTNAAMLARQCNLAREAETEAMRLRNALVETALAAGGGATDDVSDDFLCQVPGEVRLLAAENAKLHAVAEAAKEVVATWNGAHTKRMLDIAFLQLEETCK